MRIVKDPCLIDLGPNPSPRASRRRAHKFNKTTEAQGLQRKATPFLWGKEEKIQSKSGK
mgnify:CR=1 FL=1